MSVLQIGWAETSITPNKRVSLAGQFAERISEYVEKPVMATALALDTGNDHVVFCSCDLGGTAWRLVKDVREKLAGNPKIWYATSCEIYRYISAQYSLVISADETIFYNPSAIDVWVEKDKSQVIHIPAGKTVTL